MFVNGGINNLPLTHKQPEFNRWVDVWKEQEWEYVIVVGNGEGILNAPTRLFWSDNIFRIGMNRAFMLGHLNVLLHIDSFRSIKYFNPMLYSTENIKHCQKTQVVKVPPQSQQYTNDEGGTTYSSYSNSNLNVLKKMYESNEELKGLYVRKNTLFPSIDLACRISMRKIPIILCGISFDTRSHFYGNKFNIKYNDPKKAFFRKDFIELRSNSIKEMLNFICDDGYKLYYTDDSKLLSETKVKRIRYEDINYKTNF